uniref:Uncharacterized protein n=1 Tax=Lotus japonicus TaxID=34305 RepID=I3STR0_LOTJA|nr:unknown [Lotus japonicus]
MSLLYQFQFLSTFYYSMSLSNFCPCSQFNFHRFTPSVPHLTSPTVPPLHPLMTHLTHSHSFSDTQTQPNPLPLQITDSQSQRFFTSQREREQAMKQSME